MTHTNWADPLWRFMRIAADHEYVLNQMSLCGGLVNEDERKEAVTRDWSELCVAADELLKGWEPPDGPESNTKFRWNHRSRRIPPITGAILKYLWERMDANGLASAPEEDVIESAWGETAVRESAVGPQVTRLNNWLCKNDVPFRVRRKQGYFWLERAV